MSNELPCFRIHGEQNEFLLVQVLGRSHPQCDDYWDGNWIEAQISLSAGGFQGRFGASLRSEEFVRLRAGLRLVYASLGTTIPTHVAEFTTLEEQLSIKVVGDGLGHFTAECVAVDEAGTGNRLEFTLRFDQTYIPAMLTGLDALIGAFPVKGNPARVGS